MTKKVPLSERKIPIVTFNTILEFCKKNNWETLEEKYVNSRTIMGWRCKVCDYKWRTCYSNVKSRTKCPKCNNNVSKYSEKEIQDIVGKKGITLIDEWKTNMDTLSWRCLKCDYVWKAMFSNINRKKNKGCPRCFKTERYTLERVKEIALKKSITCLETEYKDCFVPMKWKCNKCEREWETSFRSLNHNIACLKCTVKETICLNLDVVRDVIKGRNIECLETEYKSAKEKMLWKCLVCKKTWRTSFTHIRYSLSGCPYCASYRSQKMCRDFFEKILGVEFPTKRPKFLEGLEYDGYSEVLQLAFEYQGQQHYRFVPYIHKTPEKFWRTLENDRKKVRLSEENGITLIHIHYSCDFKTPKKMCKVIYEKLAETGYDLFLEN